MDVQPPIQKISEETHEHLGSPTLINSSPRKTEENMELLWRNDGYVFHRIHGSINGSNGNDDSKI